MISRLSTDCKKQPQVNLKLQSSLARGLRIIDKISNLANLM